MGSSILFNKLAMFLRYFDNFLIFSKSFSILFFKHFINNQTSLLLIIVLVLFSLSVYQLQFLSDMFSINTKYCDIY